MNARIACLAVWLACCGLIGTAFPAQKSEGKDADSLPAKKIQATKFDGKKPDQAAASKNPKSKGDSSSGEKSSKPLDKLPTKSAGKLPEKSPEKIKLPGKTGEKAAEKPKDPSQKKSPEKASGKTPEKPREKTDSPDKAKDKTAARAPEKLMVKSTEKTKSTVADREAELLAFVEVHHPELATLLEQLKPAQPTEYQAALKDLDRDVRHLEQVRKRSPERSDAELALWVARSRIRLLSARLSVSEDAELREQLRALLFQLRDREVASMQQQMVQVQKSIEKQQQKLNALQQRLNDWQSSDEDWLMKQMSEWDQKHRHADRQKTKAILKGKTPSESDLESDQQPE